MSASNSLQNLNVKDSGELFGHPKGLYVLFFTELWERFSYYGMRAILVLFIVAGTDKVGAEFQGLGWSNADALNLYGWYTMLVYVASIPGGILADRVFGQKKMVMIGGLLLVAGHGIMAISGIVPFFIGLTLIVLGVGGLKPNVSTMVGGLYKEGDPRRDKGFTIFYIGINVGAFLAGISVGYVAALYGWHYGFGLAGIGMLIGQLIFMGGQKYLKGVGDFVKVKNNSTGKSISKPLTAIEKDRVIVLLISFLIVIVFWGAFEQAGGLMNIFTNERTNRVIFGLEIPAGVFQSVNSFYIMLFGTVIAGFWATRKAKGKEASSLFKMAVGTIIMGLGFFFMSGASLESQVGPSGEILTKSSVLWILGAYLFHTIGELCLSPVALSFITKLAPAKYVSIMMGVYFAVTGLGNKLAAYLGEAAQDLGELEIYTGIALFSVLFGFLLIVFY
ncbi:peptide MFS transporter, partial [Xanthovirga aplysinae]|uniref:peptide MFS transporter n=1 Tax=Xanthovirga aplysinae TaxID=2529853 RepID=UPI0012BB8814